MKKQIIEALKARFVGVSDSILDRVATKLAKTVTTEEQVATAVEGVTFQLILDSYGDSRATEAQQTAVRNYEAKHGLKDGVKVGEQAPSATPPQTGTEEVPAWAKAIIEGQKSLTERFNAFEGDRITASRRQKLSEVVGRLPEPMRKAYERTPVDNVTDDDFNTLIGDIANEVETLVKESSAKGAVFGRPSAQNGRQAQQGELSKEQLEAIGKREGAAGDNQPF